MKRDHRPLIFAQEKGEEIGSVPGQTDERAARSERYF